MSTTAALEAWLEPLLAQLEPREVRQLARRLAAGLRRRQAERIGQQRNPDGSAYQPRAAQRVRRAAQAPGSHKRERQRVQAMFTKLRTAKHLVATADAEGATVRFKNRSERISAVHQFGLVDRPQPGGPEIRYPVRQLLGFSTDDHAWLREQLLVHLVR
ncbi:MAG: phage virion morphogenesis protein [Pseudomonadota bacterium]